MLLIFICTLVCKCVATLHFSDTNQEFQKFHQIHTFFFMIGIDMSIHVCINVSLYALHFIIWPYYNWHAHTQPYQPNMYLAWSSPHNRTQFSNNFVICTASYARKLTAHLNIDFSFHFIHLIIIYFAISSLSLYSGVGLCMSMSVPCIICRNFAEAPKW